MKELIMTSKTNESPAVYKTPLYETAFIKYIKTGVVNLTSEERDELDAKKSNDGYLYPEGWLGELFKNINAYSVMFPETNHREPGYRVEYDSVRVSMFASEAALNDPTFSVIDELLEAVIEGISTIIDKNVLSNNDNHSIEGLATDNNYAFIESENSGAIIHNDLSEVLRRYNQSKASLRWYMNSDTGFKIMNPLYVAPPAGTPKEDRPKFNPVPSSILGIQVVYNEYMPGVDSGEIPVILADMHRSYLLDIQDDIYLSRTSSTTNDQGKTVDGITFTVVFNIGGRGINGDTYRCLRVK